MKELLACFKNKLKAKIESLSFKYAIYLILFILLNIDNRRTTAIIMPIIDYHFIAR